MTIKKPTRAGLMALMFGALLGLFLAVASYTPSHAQAPAAESGGVAVETLACDAKVHKECSPNSGDTAWMLTSMAIVLMMTIPGLALFYGGMVRKKNVGDTVMTSFAITCLISILWLFFTYSLAFREGGEIFGVDMGWFIGGFDRAGLQHIMSDIDNNKDNPNSLAPTIPEPLFDVPADLHHHGGAGIRPRERIVLAMLGSSPGRSVSRRSQFSPMVCSTGPTPRLLNVLISPAHRGARHPGTAGLMCALMLGVRKDRPAHNMVLT
jgi:Amt family ammonium transporter